MYACYAKNEAEKEIIEDKRHKRTNGSGKLNSAVTNYLIWCLYIKLSESLGGYLTGIFKYELPENNQFGVDFTTGWWFNRNLRIFRNIQRIDVTPQDRVLVIYGAGHMNLLNVFFEASPEYELLYVNDYLN